MAIAAVGAAAIPSIPSIPSPSAAGAPAAADGGGGFAAQAAKAMDQLQAAQSQSDGLAQQAAAGQGNLADVMIAASQASLETQMTVAVRDKALQSFNQIMGMPL